MRWPSSPCHSLSMAPYLSRRNAKGVCSRPSHLEGKFFNPRPPCSHFAASPSSSLWQTAPPPRPHLPSVLPPWLSASVTAARVAKDCEEGAAARAQGPCSCCAPAHNANQRCVATAASPICPHGHGRRGQLREHGGRHWSRCDRRQGALSPRCPHCGRTAHVHPGASTFRVPGPRWKEETCLGP